MSTNLNGPPFIGGKPKPNTAPISPSVGEATIPSWKQTTASFINLEAKRHWIVSLSFL